MKNVLPIIMSYEKDGDWKVEYPTIGNSGKTRWLDGSLSAEKAYEIAVKNYYSLKAMTA